MVLRINRKLDLVRALLSGDGLQELLGLLSPLELLEAYRFVQEKTIEFGVRVRGKKFAQEEMLAELRALGEAHAARTCPDQNRQCRLEQCLEGHPQCLREAAVTQILAMASVCRSFLHPQETS
ncbi:MAG TPA: hypothetical protein PLG50_13045 [bacterium]|nr:hypothetical protein [bacterium]HQG46579.1 hypothetical protein [bacterium]HQI49277.1 hypothetical protein [bacterium]HQJ63293.1 hypothetical protein [bacterium]